MRLYYPKSFLKLVLVGLLLVALPTLFVLLSMAVSVDQLARRSQTAVQEAAQATQASRRVMGRSMWTAAPFRSRWKASRC